MDLRLRAAAACLALCSLSPALAEGSPAAEIDLKETFDGLSAPAILGSVPAPAKITFGRAEIRPASNARLLVLGANGEPCGWVLDGPAALVYRVEDRYSVPIVRRNMKRAHGVDVSQAGGALTLNAALDGAALWGWGLDLGEMTPATGAEISPPAWMREILDGMVETDPARDMLQARLNGDVEYRWALLHGKQDEFFLNVDSRPSARMESLARLDKIAPGDGPFAGRYSSEELASQPIGQDWIDSAPFDFVALDTEIALKENDHRHLEVTSRSKVQVLRDGLRLLRFNLWSDIYDEHERRRDYDISRLRVNGTQVPYLHRWDSLYVLLPSSTKRGDTFDLEVAVAGDVLVQPAGFNFWRLSGGWYPKPPTTSVEMAEFRISMDVPEPWLPFAPGEIVERTSANGRNRVRTKLKGPMEGPDVLAGKYSMVTEEDGGERIHVSTYASVKEDQARRLARIIFAIRSCLEKWTGVSNPFQDLEVIELPAWGWGEAPPGMIFITQEAFLTRATAKLEASEVIGEVFTRGINERIAHETAHAWFPHVAKVVRIEENWLSESLADYTSAYCLAESMSKREGKYHWNRQLDEWKYWSKVAGDDASVFLASHTSSTENNARNWQYLNYGRGPLILEGIRQKLIAKHGEEKGEAMFLSWIRSYVKTFEFKFAETRHLIGILDQISGERWEPYFEAHLLGTEPPEVK